MTKKKKAYVKVALALSLLAILVWAIMGTGASLAWFRDTSNDLNNIFHFAEFDLEVSHRLDDGTYEVIDAETKIFDDEALYEPGYVQVVYLRVENKGTVPFDFKTAVSVTDYTIAVNAYGQRFNLQDYLRFGISVNDTEAEMDESVSTRGKARVLADMPLNNYSTDIASLGAGEDVYIALIVRMPEAIGNEANYRGDTVPKVELGLIVNATQQND